MSPVTTPFSFGGRAADLARVGRFADAATLLRADQGPPDAVLLLELLDHARAGLDSAPETSARDLSMALSPSIPDLAPALALIVLASRDGRVYEAARVASTLAATLEASVAALVLRLPGALLHRQLADDALRHLVDGDGGGALERALAARRLTPASPSSAELLAQAKP